MLNQIILIGRRTDENELKHSKDKAYLNFNIAVKKNYKNSEGEILSDFFNITCFGHTAEYVNKYLKKGKLVSVSGRVENNVYEKDGEKVYSLKIIAENVNVLEYSSEKEITE